MTFEVTVKSKVDGSGIGGLFVQANDEITGASFCRSTDGNGYANVAMFDAKIGDRVTLLIDDPEYRFKGLVMGDALVITAEDQVIEVALDPFV